MGMRKFIKKHKKNVQVGNNALSRKTFFDAFTKFYMLLLLMFGLSACIHDTIGVLKEKSNILAIPKNISAPLIPEQSVFENHEGDPFAEYDQTKDHNNAQIITHEGEFKNSANHIQSLNDEEENKVKEEKKILISELAKFPPRYVAGDYYVFSNPEIIWTVVKVKNGLVHWRSDSGATQTTYQNPILPALEWDSKINGHGKRVLSKRKGHAFPLGVGNEISFLSSVTADQAPYRWQAYWTCKVVEMLDEYQTLVGFVPVFRINCGTNDVVSMSFLYAPTIGHYVALETVEKGSNTIRRREILDYGNRALAHIRDHYVQERPELLEDKEHNNFSTISSQEEQQAVIKLAELDSEIIEPAIDNRSQNAGIAEIPQYSPELPDSRERNTLDGASHLRNYNQQQQNSVQSKLDTLPITEYVGVPRFNAGVGINENLPASRIPDFVQEVHKLSNRNPYSSKINDGKNSYKEELPQNTVQQAEALLKKRFKSRLSSSSFNDIDENINTEIISAKEQEETIHAAFNLPRKVIRPNRQIEALADQQLGRPHSFGLEGSYEEDKLSTEEYLKGTNPEYKEVIPIDDIERSRVSLFNYKSTSQQPDQLAHLRNPIAEQWHDVRAKNQQRANNNFNNVALRDALKKVEEQQKQFWKHNRQPIGGRAEDIIIKESGPSQRLESNVAAHRVHSLELATVRSKKEAAFIWKKTYENHKDILKGLTPSTQKITYEDNSIYYKLLAVGSISIASAHERCRALLNRAGVCNSVLKH